MKRLWRSFGTLGFCYTLAATVSMVGAVGASSYLSLLRQREEWFAGLRERSAPIMHHAHALAAAVASGRPQRAASELKRWVAGLPTSSASAYGPGGRPLCSLPPGVAPAPLTPSELGRLTRAREPLAAMGNHPGQPTYVVLLPLREGEGLVGAVRLVYPLDEVLLHEGAAGRHAASMTAGVAVVGVLLAYLLKGLALSPLRRLSRAMRRVAAGDLEREVAEPTDPEVAEAVRAFNQMTRRLGAARRELEHYNECLEAEVAAARRELERAQDRLIRHARLASTGQLAAGLAHELNNPLTGILMVTSCLQDEGRASGLREELDEVERQARRCQAIVGKLLAFATDAPLRRRRADLNHIVERAIGRARAERAGRAARLRHSLDPSLPHVAGDPDLLEEALLGILANALQATEDGGSVSVAARARGGRVEVVVADTGRGMSRQEVERALDPFYTTRQAGEGMGLGLSMSYSIVRRHGGEMTIESVEGKGTTVCIALPAAAASPSRAPHAEEERRGLSAS